MAASGGTERADGRGIQLISALASESNDDATVILSAAQVMERMCGDNPAILMELLTIRHAAMKSAARNYSVLRWLERQGLKPSAECVEGILSAARINRSR